MVSDNIVWCYLVNFLVLVLFKTNHIILSRVQILIIWWVGGHQCSLLNHYFLSLYIHFQLFLKFLNLLHGLKWIGRSTQYNCSNNYYKQARWLHSRCCKVWHSHLNQLFISLYKDGCTLQYLQGSILQVGIYYILVQIPITTFSYDNYIFNHFN